MARVADTAFAQLLPILSASMRHRSANWTSGHGWHDLAAAIRRIPLAQLIRTSHGSFVDSQSRRAAREVWAALDRATPEIVRLLGSHGIIGVHYVVGFVHPRPLSRAGY